LKNFKFLIHAVFFFGLLRFVTISSFRNGGVAIIFASRRSNFALSPGWVFQPFPDFTRKARVSG